MNYQGVSDYVLMARVSEKEIGGDTEIEGERRSEREGEKGRQGRAGERRRETERKKERKKVVDLGGHALERTTKGLNCEVCYLSAARVVGGASGSRASGGDARRDCSPECERRAVHMHSVKPARGPTSKCSGPALLWIGLRR